jgi:hypothetical protein
VRTLSNYFGGGQRKIFRRTRSPPRGMRRNLLPCNLVQKKTSLSRTIPVAPAPTAAAGTPTPHRTHRLSLSRRRTSQPRPLPFSAALNHGRRQQLGHLFKRPSSTPLLPRERDPRSTSAAKVSSWSPMGHASTPAPRRSAGWPLLRTPLSKGAASATARLNYCCRQALSKV